MSKSVADMFLSPKEGGEYLILGVVAVAGIYALVKWGIPAITKATANAASGAVTQTAAAVGDAAVNVAQIANSTGGTLLDQADIAIGVDPNGPLQSWSSLWAYITGSDSNTTSPSTSANPNGTTGIPTDFGVTGGW